MDGFKRYIMDENNQLHQLVSVQYDDNVRLCAECSLQNECSMKRGGILCDYAGSEHAPLPEHFEKVPCTTCPLAPKCEPARGIICLSDGFRKGNCMKK